MVGHSVPGFIQKRRQSDQILTSVILFSSIPDYINILFKTISQHYISNITPITLNQDISMLTLDTLL